MLDLIILSIFRQSEKYLPRYLQQVSDVFDIGGGECGVVWLEGDSTDETYHTLCDAKQEFINNGYYVDLIKYDCNGPYWKSIVNSKRWQQLSTCWNRCLDSLVPAKHTVCVESDIKYQPSIVYELINNLDEKHHVVYPMLMIDNVLDKSGHEIFYDTWGFSINNEHFENVYPYYKAPQPGDLVKLTSGGGMIVSTYKYQQRGRFDPNSCIMQYPEDTNLYMNRLFRTYHPSPF